MTALNEAVGPPTGVPNRTVSEEQMRRRLTVAAGVEQALLALVAGKPAGMLSLRVVPYLSDDVRYAEVTELVVDTAYRRRGVATALMSAAERLAAARGCRYLHVDAWHTNAEAQALYRALAYEAVEIGFEKPLPDDPRL